MDGILSTVATVALVTAGMYVSVIVGVRLAGRRTLAHVSAFDGVVTIALGSILGGTAVSNEPDLTRGVAAVATLLVLQLGVGLLRRRFELARRIFDFAPVALIHHGERVGRDSWSTTQLTDGELKSKLRAEGVFDMDEVEEAILEPGGEVSIRRRGGA